MRHKSVAIVGMAKNTGKTTCLNYVLDKLYKDNKKIAVTSIGVDGEERDVLYDTLKPRITLRKANYFITSEKHFQDRELEAKVLEISNKTTALGHLVTAQAESEGKVILSGPSDSLWLQSCIDSLHNFNIDVVLVDGALSRMSLASPAITDAMVLCTGAACSINLDQLVKKVKYQCELINLNQVDENLLSVCDTIQEGVWGLNNNGETYEKITDSLFLEFNFTDELSTKYEYVFVNGALTEKFLKTISAEAKVSEIKLIVRDFSKIFVQPATFKRFLRRGGSIEVLQKAKLLAICTNPTSPEGYNFEPETLRLAIQNEINIPVFDVFQEIKKQNSNN
ncbi:MAG: hypothetical protein GX879_03535 [Bacteroidales bacterium]|nr:hypothetical protein [Bacteroidales bacterium]